MYITLDEFTAFGGKDFDEVVEFDKICRKAESFVDYYTQGRLKGIDTVPKEVKLALFEIIELILEGNAGISSYSSDGVSVSLENQFSFEDKVYEIIRRNLPQKLLYLGVDKN